MVVVLDVYPARERAEDFPGVSGWLVAAAAADAAGGRPVYWTPALDDAERLLREELGEGDALLTLGRGRRRHAWRGPSPRWVGLAPRRANNPLVRDLAAALPRTLAALPARIASRPVRLSLSPHTRRRLVLAALVRAPVAGLYQFWLRDSSLVAVDEVEVTGLTTKDAPRIQATLEAAAEDMTTLHVRTDELEEVAASSRSSRRSRSSATSRTACGSQVTERRPAALVSVGGVPLPVAGDGTRARAAPRPPEGLPLLRMEKPAADGRVTDPRTLRALLVAGAAPARLPAADRARDRGARAGHRGRARGRARRSSSATPTTRSRSGPRPLRVLADPDAAGATYIDVRLPERPVAGGLPVETIEPVAPAGDVVAPPVEPTVPRDRGRPSTRRPRRPRRATDPAATAPAPAPTTPRRRRPRRRPRRPRRPSPQP